MSWPKPVLTLFKEKSGRLTEIIFPPKEGYFSARRIGAGLNGNTISNQFRRVPAMPAHGVDTAVSK